jgi:hypothetical protein
MEVRSPDLGKGGTVKTKPFKYVVTPVAVEVDDDGRVSREIVGEAKALYTPAQVFEFVSQVEAQLAGTEE